MRRSVVLGIIRRRRRSAHEQLLVLAHCGAVGAGGKLLMGLLVVWTLIVATSVRVLVLLRRLPAVPVVVAVLRLGHGECCRA
jgi:hypothetical protein